MPRLRFAGQITGCEGYVESAAVGLMTGRFAAAERQGSRRVAPPATTAMGALLGHITGGADAATFQPMNVNFGLFPPIDGDLPRQGAQAGAQRARLARLRPMDCADAARRGVIPSLSCRHLPPPSYRRWPAGPERKAAVEDLQFQI